MNILDFSEFKTGQLVPITHEGKASHAFCPNLLPPAWEFDVKLWPLVTEARDAVSKLDGISKWLPNPLLLLRPMQWREAWRSNMLEGTYASPDQFLLFEMEDRSERRRSATPASEVANYRRALRFGTNVLRAGRKIDGRFIRRLQEMIVGHGRGAEKSPGKYRASQVFVRGVYTPPPADVAFQSMEAMESFLDKKSTAYDPLVRAYIAHYQFEAIHPFRDGNGRTGRLLLSLTTALWLGHSNPWLYMSAYFDRNKNEYFERMYRVSTRGEWTEWIEFCLLGTRVQARNSIAICENLENLRRAYQGRCATIGPRFYEIIDYLFEQPLVTIPMIRKRLGMTHPPVAKYVNQLCDLGVLEHAFGERPKYFKAAQIIKTAYSHDDE